MASLRKEARDWRSARSFSFSSAVPPTSYWVSKSGFVVIVTGASEKVGVVTRTGFNLGVQLFPGLLVENFLDFLSFFLILL